MWELGQIKARDLSRINVNLPEDVLYWCREFGCSEANLQMAVREVGSSVEAVRRKITGRWR